VCIELEEEKAKHARDMEQGDNVTYMLEKDRERLKQEVTRDINLILETELDQIVILSCASLFACLFNFSIFSSTHVDQELCQPYLTGPAVSLAAKCGTLEVEEKESL
jgi:hypothetical protein